MEGCSPVQLKKRSGRQDLPNQSERILDHAREQLRKRFGNIDVFSGVGDATREILKTAEELKADLIAVGCRGLRGIKGILGSVSRNILTHSECSILIGKTCKD
jgi:nucleotide-binding universal stress UspA family protein